MTVITYDFTPSKPLIKNLDNNNKQSLNGVYASKTIQMGKVDYKAESMYFLENVHDETPSQDNFELVIEHSDIGSNDKIYLCIPLQVQTSSPGNSTSLFINSKENESIPFDLAGDLPDNIQAKAYEDGVNKVLVLTTPIYVSLSGSTKIPTTNLPFRSQTLSEKIKTIDLHPDNQIYIDCNPSGESAETIAAYNVPINSEYAKNEGKMNYERQAMYSGVFAIALVLIYFIVPWWYRTYVVESVINWMGTQSISSLKRKNANYSGEVRIAQINTWLIFLCVLYLLVNFTIGISSDPELLTQTTYVAIMIALSVISIIIKGDNSTFYKHKHARDGYDVQLYELLFTQGNDSKWDETRDKYAGVLSIPTLLGAFSSGKIEGTPWYYVWIGVAIIAIIYGGLQFGINKDSTSSDSSISKTVFDGIFYSTFVVMLGYMMYNYKPSESDVLKDEEPEDKGLFGNAMSGIGDFLGKFDPFGLKKKYNIDGKPLMGGYNKKNKVAPAPDS